MPDPLLATEDLTRRFGALAAVDRVSLAFAAGGVHAVIGPNGAGKSTLINLLSGELRPSGGRIRFKGRDVSREPPDRLSSWASAAATRPPTYFRGSAAATACGWPPSRACPPRCASSGQPIVSPASRSALGAPWSNAASRPAAESWQSG